MKKYWVVRQVRVPNGERYGRLETEWFDLAFEWKSRREWVTSFDKIEDARAIADRVGGYVWSKPTALRRIARFLRRKWRNFKRWLDTPDVAEDHG